MNQKLKFTNEATFASSEIYNYLLTDKPERIIYFFFENHKEAKDCPKKGRMQRMYLKFIEQYKFNKQEQSILIPIPLNVFPLIGNKEQLLEHYNNDIFPSMNLNVRLEIVNDKTYIRFFLNDQEWMDLLRYFCIYLYGYLGYNHHTSKTYNQVIERLLEKANLENKLITPQCLFDKLERTWMLNKGNQMVMEYIG